MKVTGSGEIQFNLVGNLAKFDVTWPLAAELSTRTARLVCTTQAYAVLWEGALQKEWSYSSVVRSASERRMLSVELDALSALYLGLSIDELCTIYRTQFPVLRGYEKSDLYDLNGRKVPPTVAKKVTKDLEPDLSPIIDRRWTHPQSGIEYTFEPPFRSFDREEDMRTAYAKFSKMLEEHGEIIEDGE